MKQFLIIFKFEFLQLIKTKAYKITTLIFCLVATLGLFIPTFFMNNESDSANTGSYNDKIVFAIFDENNVVKSDASIKTFFPKAQIKKATSEADLKEMVKEEKADAGIVVENDLKFRYYVFNSDMMDTKPAILSQALTLNYRTDKLSALGMDEKEALKISGTQVLYESEVLGNDGAQNFAYTMILVVAIYMVVIMYGQIIATNVASEKGNRTMELLATSANPTSLIFGKVLSGCLAATVQIGLFIGFAEITYSFVRDAYGGMLDMLLNIPMDVLGAFALFGIFGFIFYAFIFGALGALVSKSEDVNSSATPITLIFVAVYVIVYMGIMDPNSSLFTIASFVPFSSPMAMFARMALVEVPLIEIIISFLILVLSTIAIGLGASKIYRRATLMYGNQIKLMHAFKWVSKKD